jgi:hypothetical protein
MELITEFLIPKKSMPHDKMLAYIQKIKDGFSNTKFECLIGPHMEYIKVVVLYDAHNKKSDVIIQEQYETCECMGPYVDCHTACHGE